MATEQQTVKRTVQDVSPGRLLVLLPLAILARLWAASLRMEPTPRFREALRRDEPQVFLLWHNRLFVIAEINRRFRRPFAHRRMYGLISASKDGAWLAAFFKLVGIGSIRGSSSWRGMEALREIIRAVSTGGDIGITPDGPRGPCYAFHAGALLAARKAGTPLVLMGMQWTRARRLRSWDGFYLPLPFSRVILDAQVVEREELLASRDMTKQQLSADQLRETLMALNPDDTAHPRGQASSAAKD